MGQMVLTDDDLDVDAEIVGAAEDFDDAADAALTIGGKLQHLYIDDEAMQFLDGGGDGGFGANAVDVGGGGGKLHAGGDEDPVTQTVVMGLHPIGGLLHLKLADYGAVSALENFEDLAFGAAVAADPSHASKDAVAVHSLGRAVGGDEEVAGEAGDGRLGDDEAIAIAMDTQLPGDELGAGTGGKEVVTLDFDEPATGEGLFERPFQRGPFDATAIEFLHQLLEGGAMVRLLGDIADEQLIGELAATEPDLSLLPPAGALAVG